MLFKPVAVLALAGSAFAGWVIEDPISWSAKNDQQLGSMTQAYASAVDAYYATLTTGAAWTKAVDVMRAYQETGKDVPGVVTATDTTTTYTTTPAWYDAMPTEAKSVFDGMKTKDEQIQSSIQASANKANDAARPVGMGLWVSGAFVAMVAGAAVVL